MKHFNLRTRDILWMTALAAVVASPLAAAPQPRQADPKNYFRQSPMLSNPEKAPIYAAARAGQRVVGVGDYGMIIFTDDGKTFRQAKTPTRSPLTSVYFLDAKRGWAAGHDGTVLATDDGGASWRLLRESTGEDEVLMSVWFENPQHGLVVGQFGLAMVTEDGGKTWQDVHLAEGEVGEKHLLDLVPGHGGVLLVAAEAGAIFRSEDSGRHWQAIQTDNKGSFWTGTRLADGSFLMAGMRGHVYRSSDVGRTWHEVPSGTQQSITGIHQRPDGSIRLVGLAGTNLISKDGGHRFEASTRPDRAGQTAVAGIGDKDLVFTALGVVIRD